GHGLAAQARQALINNCINLNSIVNGVLLPHRKQEEEKFRAATGQRRISHNQTQEKSYARRIDDEFKKYKKCSRTNRRTILLKLSGWKNALRNGIRNW